ncbi:MAG: type VI secretion system baseplate subunit TssG [Thermodesulfobacteriota bacterium]
MIDDLLKRSRRYSFVQAVRLLRVFSASKSTEDTEGGGGRSAEDFWRNTLRVRPELSLHFPGADIAAVDRITAENGDVAGGPQFRITATFLGLYGVSSPLPAFYTEDLMDEAREDSSVIRDFMDIVNGPLYPLLFMSWSKYRMALRVVEEKSSADLERLYCLAGMGDAAIRDRVDAPYPLIRYAGLLTQSPRSALGLERLLSDAFEEPKLKVIPGIPRKAVIPEDQRLHLVAGKTEKRLGRNSFLGRRIRDRMGKFRVRISTLQAEGFQAWLPDTPRFDKLRSLIRVYLDQPLSWELEVVLAEGEVSTARPGRADWGRLGWNTWLFAKDRPEGKAGVVFRAKPRRFDFSQSIRRRQVIQ